jgi:peptide/nickel transport system permease protein
MRADVVAAIAPRDLMADEGTTPARAYLPRSRALLTRVALGTLALLALAALLAPWLAPYDPIAQPDAVGLRLRPPSLAHPFGTDQYSRDLLSRVLWGARVSLGVAVTSVALATLVGTTVGVLAGYAGRTLDAALMRAVDALMAIPRVLLLVAVVGLWGRLGVVPLVLLLGLTGWMGVARLVRAEARGVAAREHVLAARALGAGHLRVLARHVLPACLTPAVVAATLGVPQVIALEAGLSYLGLGVQPPFASWGTLIHDGADLLAIAWWISVIPGLARRPRPA